ncbi:MAG TPA: hypothetical protein ENJ82_07835 [Bacteroidetes bacterium]|nr:hypothetical protein [Bacteroidota bacterium]
MKNMKFSLLAAFAMMLAVSSFTGCTDPCKDVTCVKGECVEGDCVCDTGYEGVDCGTALNAKFDGSFSMTAETCTNSGSISAPYAVTIAASSTDPSKIVFTGLYEEAGATANAVIATNGTDLTIARANYSNFNAEIAGTGTLSADKSTLTLTYTIYDSGNGNVLDVCTSTLTRQ